MQKRIVLISSSLLQPDRKISMSYNLLSHARKVQSEKGTIQLVNEGTRFIFQRLSWYTAVRPRIVAAVYDHIIDVHDRDSLGQSAHKTYFYSESSSFEVGEPICFQDPPDNITHICGQHTFQQPFVCEIRDATLMRETGFGLTSDQELILDAVSSRRDSVEKYLLKNPNQIYNLVRRQSRTSRNPDQEYAVAAPLKIGPFPRSKDPGFAHWTLYKLAHLEAIETYIENTGRVPTILLRPNTPETCIESLVKFGYDRDKIEIWDPSKELKIKRMVIPSVRRNEGLLPFHKWRRRRKTDRWYNSVPPTATQWLADAAKSRMPQAFHNSSYSNHVYISRGDADKRKVLNESELISKLEEHGFKSYQLKEMSFKHQVELFANADKIVAPHGAGLANLAFSSDCAVVELFGTKTRPTFFMLAEKKELNYGMVVGEPDSEYNNMYIEPDRVVNMIETIT